MSVLNSKCKNMAGVFTVLLACVWCATHLSAQQLIYSDNFSTTNALWSFALNCTQSNATAIAASYAKIENGMLQLKANVDCGWDYVEALAILNLSLPDEYEITYNTLKTQWCGWAGTGIRSTFSTAMCCPSGSVLSFSGGGDVWTGLGYNDSQPDGCGANLGWVTLASPINSSFNWGTFHAIRIIKHHDEIDIFVDGVLNWTYTGVTQDGGFLAFDTSQAGATVDRKSVV